MATMVKLYNRNIVFYKNRDHIHSFQLQFKVYYFINQSGGFGHSGLLAPSPVVLDRKDELGNVKEGITVKG